MTDTMQDALEASRSAEAERADAERVATQARLAAEAKRLKVVQISRRRTVVWAMRVLRSGGWDARQLEEARAAFRTAVMEGAGIEPAYLRVQQLELEEHVYHRRAYQAAFELWSMRHVAGDDAYERACGDDEDAKRMGQAEPRWHREWIDPPIPLAEMVQDVLTAEIRRRREGAFASIDAELAAARSDQT